MLQIDKGTDHISLAGRFDATQVDTASEVFDSVEQSTTVRFDDLDYISSAGLSVLLHTQQRLSRDGHGLRLAGMNPHVRLVFEYAVRRVDDGHLLAEGHTTLASVDTDGRPMRLPRAVRERMAAASES